MLSILAFSPPSPRVGGAELQMHALHQGLRARGVDVQVLADAAEVGPGEHEADGVPVWGVPLPALTSSPLRPGTVRAWLRERAIPAFVRRRVGRVDLVQATPFRQPALWAAAVAAAQGVPWVARIAASGGIGDLTYMRVHWRTRRALPRLLAGVSAAVAVDDATAAEACAAGLDPARVVRIDSGLTVAVPEVAEAVRPRAGGTVLFVGRLAPEKRLETLLQAWALLGAGEAPGPLPPLELVGGGALPAGVPAEALAGVTLHGHQRPEPFLARARCFVNASSSEGMPNAVLEACAFGVPPVLSDIPVHRRIAAAAGTEELLFPVGDAAALAASLRRVLALDPAREAELRARAAAYGRRFTPAARDEAYLELYRRVLAGRGA